MRRLASEPIATVTVIARREVREREPIRSSPVRLHPPLPLSRHPTVDLCPLPPSVLRWFTSRHPSRRRLHLAYVTLPTPRIFPFN